MKKKQFVLILFLLLFGELVFAQKTQLIVDSLFYGKTGIKEKYPTVGLSIGIIQNNKISFHQFGNKNKELNEPIDKNTIFEIGSATKTFTGLLLAIEIANNKISKSEFIDTFFNPKILPTNISNKVKITDLASHQSGLPNLSNDKYLKELLQKDVTNPFQFASTNYLLDILVKTDTLFNPKKYQYNNYAFSLLGHILAKKKQCSYEELLKNVILNPMGMKRTSLNQAKTNNVAGLYDEDGNPQKNIILNAVNPAGGLRSNAVDMIKYLKLQLGISKANLQKAVQISHETYYSDEKQKVSLGWDIKNGYFQKDGDTFGNSCLLLFDKTNQIGIVVLSNHQNADIVNYAVDYIYKKLLALDK